MEGRRPLWGHTLRRDLDFNEYGGVNLGKLLRDLLASDHWVELGMAVGWTAVTSGSGVTVQEPRRLRIDSGSTLNSYAALTHNTNVPNQVGQTAGVIDWNKVQVFVVQFMVYDNTATGVCRVAWGNQNNIASQQVKGITMKIENLALKGEVHNGTSLTILDLNTTLVARKVYKVFVVSYGDETAEWFLDSGSGLLSVGTSNAGPTGTSTGADQTGFYAANGASGRQHLMVSSHKLYTQQ